MSRQINQPINQVRLTNVAVVRMNRGGRRFEIACYRNKVVDFRQGLETDLSEVLQTERIFTNVSKGEFAKAKDLEKVFGTKDEEEIARAILSKGQVQVSDKERSQQLDKTNAQIAEWISKNCVQPNTDRPYTISQIRHCMQQANFNVHPTKPLKRQYLDCVKLLQSIIPIQRAKMELLLLVPDREEATEAVENTMKENDIDWELQAKANVENKDAKDSNRLYKITVDPSLYRVLNDAIQETPGAYIEIVQQVVTKQGGGDLETELDHQPDLPGANTETVPVAEARESVRKPPGETNLVSNDEKGESGVSDDDTEDLAVNRRKQQKKNKKKNKKNQRREESDVPPSSDVQTSPGHSKSEPSSATAFNTGSGHIVSTTTAAGDSSGKSCNTCGGSFETPSAYRAHFKSDWHRFNQKLKMKGAAPISEEEFQLVDSDSFFGGISGDAIL